MASPEPFASSPQTLKQRAVREAKNFAIIFVYVWVIDGLFTLYKAQILGQPPLTGQLYSLINALVLGKIILLLDIFKVGEVLHNKAPIFRVLFKAALFALLLLAFSILEDAVDGYFRNETFTESISKIAGGRWEGMLIIAVIVGVALVPYLTCKEITRVIGPYAVVSIIFRPPSNRDQPPSSAKPPV